MTAWESDALIVDAVRSPIGRRNGTLSHIRGDELSAQVLNALLGRNDVDPAEIEDVEWGCVTQVDEQAWNIGRNVALTAGWPVSVSGTTVDRQCGSSMQTNFNAAAAVGAALAAVTIRNPARPAPAAVPAGAGQRPLLHCGLDCPPARSAEPVRSAGLA